jgi:hypothetical protein
MFKKEWLSEMIETKIPSSKHRQKAKIGDIFIHWETDDVCSICSEVNALSEFTSGKKWNKWNLDELKRHSKQEVHVNSIIKLQNLKKGGIVRILTETKEDWKLSVEVTERKRTDADMVKILIGNVILAIKVNASMLSVQDNYDQISVSYVDYRQKYSILLLTIVIRVKL